MEGYEKLAEEVVSCAAGFPLVLEVWGAHLGYFKTVDLWRSALNKLIKIPLSDVQRKLKISYDSLGDREKKLFLDIACFFFGMNRDFVVKVSHDESLGAFPDSEIELLVGRCLVRISGNEVSMHDVIRDMGREIVRLECVDEPGRRSRLWDRMHVIDVLKECSGTKAIESIILHSCEQKEEVIAHPKAFERMRNLRLIHLDNLILSGASNGDMPTFSFKKLKYLRWYGFPLKHLPSNLDMRNVVAINLQYSKLETLQGIKSLKKLQFLDVSYSSFLTKSPDLTGLENLEEMLFRDCTNLEELHSSVGCLDKLVVLDLSNCTRLRRFPSKSIRKLRSLQRLDLTCCQNIEWDKHIEHLLSSLKECCVTELALAKCNISKVPGELLNLASLKNLNLSYNGFHSLPGSLINLHHLYTINLSHCFRLQSIPDLPISLSSIKASECSSLMDLPSNLSKLKSLSILNLSQCPKLGFADPLCLMKFRGLSYLDKLDMRYCNVSFVPDEIGSLVSLESLNLSGNIFSSLPDSLGSLRKLMYLYLDDCAQLKSIPPLPSNVQNIRAVECDTLDVMSLILIQMTGFSNCPEPVYEITGRFRQWYQQRSMGFALDFFIEVSGTEVPIWCNYQSGGYFLSFVAPQQVDRKIRGLILCLILSNAFARWGIDVELVNKTKGTSYVSQLWISKRLTLFCVTCFIPDSKFVVEGGDNVQVVVFHGQLSKEPFLKVEKCGACLIYEGDETDPELCHQNVIKNTSHDPNETFELDEDAAIDTDEDNETLVEGC